MSAIKCSKFFKEEEKIITRIKDTSIDMIQEVYEPIKNFFIHQHVLMMLLTD